jgi:hypothetical protein
MICQKCLQTLEDDKGRNYLFYYGLQTGVRYSTYGSATSYQILGSDQAFVCDTCVDAWATHRYVNYCRYAAFYIVITPLPVSWLFLVVGVNFLLVYGLPLLCALLVFLSGEWLNRRAKRQHFLHVSGSSQAKYGSEVAVEAASRDFVTKALKKDKDKASQGKSTEDILKNMYILFTPEKMRRLKRVRT